MGIVLREEEAHSEDETKDAREDGSAQQKMPLVVGFHSTLNTVAFGTYRLPVAKIAEMPSFRAFDICKCQIFHSGMKYIAMSETMLKTDEAM